ncbi:MAG: arginase [Bacteroidetes bacterium]|nr:MAG: arginase [Bacteroidota bacterium]
MSSIKIVNSRSEIGAGTRGASLGIEALKIASLRAHSNYFIDKYSEEVLNHNHLIFETSKFEDENAHNIVGLIELCEDFCSVLKKVYSEGKFPIVLAGDHSSAAGTIAGIKHSYPDKRLGVIWVDAHADLHSPYTSPTGNVHGMPLAVSLGEDNLDKVKNTISSHSKEKWDLLKNVGGIIPKIYPQDLVFIGVRDTEEEEEYLIDKYNIKNIEVDELQKKGPSIVASETLDYLEECDIIYITFDVDSMDPDLVSHGTGTPVPNGFSELEVTELLVELNKSSKICCFEITEINPTLDEKVNTMADTAFRVLETVSKTIESKFATSSS